MVHDALRGVGVLVTRPLLQATALVRAIESHGGRAIQFPVIDIIPRDAEQTRIAAAALATPDIAIFVSSNAVRHGLQFADGALTGVVGPATADAIRAGGRNVDIAPLTGFDSEGLLQHPVLLDVAGKHVRIIRSKTGRELLSSTLRERGATVDTLAVYDRIQPTPNAAVLQDLETHWRQNSINVVTIMSIESFRNLERLLPDAMVSELDQALLVTPALRVSKEVLKRYPAARTALATEPDATAMVDAIIRHSQ